MSVDLLSNEQLSQANHDLRARLAETERALQSRLREIAEAIILIENMRKK